MAWEQYNWNKQVTCVHMTKQIRSLHGMFLPCVDPKWGQSSASNTFLMDRSGAQKYISCKVGGKTKTCTLNMHRFP